MYRVFNGISCFHHLLYHSRLLQIRNLRLWSREVKAYDLQSLKQEEEMPWNTLYIMSQSPDLEFVLLCPLAKKHPAGELAGKKFGDAQNLWLCFSISQ